VKKVKKLIGIGILILILLSTGAIEGCSCQPSQPEQPSQSAPPQQPTQPSQPTQPTKPSPPSPLTVEVIEITSDELLSKIYTVVKGKEEGKNVAELENWLLSLSGKKIELAGEISWVDKDLINNEYIPREIYFGKRFDWSYDSPAFTIAAIPTIAAKSDPSVMRRIKEVQVGQPVFIEGKVEKISFENMGHSIYCIITFDKLY